MSITERSPRLFVKIRRENLPQVRDRYPCIYLAHGRLEVDDSSIKWIDHEGGVIHLPAATLQSLMLGPGTSVTHEAIKVLASLKCTTMWVGEDSLLYYATGISPTADTRNFLRQIQAATDPARSICVARRMYARRFPDADLSSKSLPEMMGLEGIRVKKLYAEKSRIYGVSWHGRRFTPGSRDASDIPNRLLTSFNAALYGILSSVIHASGFSPHIGFIHSGCPLPFVYDMADLYKSELCIDLTFKLTAKLHGNNDRKIVSAAFREKVLEIDLLGRVVDDINEMIGE